MYKSVNTEFTANTSFVFHFYFRNIEALIKEVSSLLNIIALFHDVHVHEDCRAINSRFRSMREKEVRCGTNLNKSSFQLLSRAECFS